jgi:hypothetical protein
LRLVPRRDPSSQPGTRLGDASMLIARA